MSTITVCKNVIMQNNKKQWKEPAPPIRIARGRNANADQHGFRVAIKDRAGDVVAIIDTTRNGEPIVKCGAKVAIDTVYPVEVLQ